eukprot:gnl/Trimastix_PCT/182.p1 GENE.gnl/Trimastix_PCT/182~~gnl/Trimastix_PCT/182.p1  ORF type:complete len:305 (-),score=119.27 gnl/Trimastix_PCT/182:913-1827(-)
MSTCCKISVAAGVVSAVVLVILIIVIVSMIHFVDIGYIALDMNTYTNDVDITKVYYEGRHASGIGHEFLQFPRYQKTLEYVGSSAITCQTPDGLALRLDCSVQYHIIPEELGLLWRAAMKGYESIFRSETEEAIRSVAGSYDAHKFFSNRTEIGRAMLQRVGVALKALHANATHFQLRSIDLPDSFEDQIVNTEVARQNIVLARYQQEVDRIKAETDIIKSEMNREIKAINADADAKVSIIVKTAEAEGTLLTKNADAQGDSLIRQSLNFNSSQLLRYTYIANLKEHPSSKMIVGLNQAIISAA